MYYDLESGAIQVSTVGPFLYAIYMSPLFDIVLVLSFADASYDEEMNSNTNILVKDMEKSPKSITKW